MAENQKTSFTKKFLYFMRHLIPDAQTPNPKLTFYHPLLLFIHSKYSKCHKKWEKNFSMPKNHLKPIYGQYVVGLEPFGTFKSGFGCYHSSILGLGVRKAVKMGKFAYFSFLDYQSSKSLFLWSRCVWMGSYEGYWSTLKP